MDLLQAPHTWSGIEMALWDLLGKARGEPVWRLLGYPRAFNKTPYASQLFGNSPTETLAGGRSARAAGFRAVKFGWGPFGTGTLEADIEQLDAAREGLGPDGILLVDAGQIFGADLEAAHNSDMAEHLIDYGQVGFIQIDCGRIGGIGPAKRVADYAVARGVTYVNHTFTSHLALAASLQPYAGLAEHTICEYPFAPKPLAWDLSVNHILPDAAGEVSLPEAVGLGIEIDKAALQKYLVPVEIEVKGRTLYSSPL